MEREEIEQVAEEFAQRRYINGCAVPTGNMISKSIACREGFKSGAQWQRNHVWNGISQRPKDGSLVLAMIPQGGMIAGPNHDGWEDTVNDLHIMAWAYFNDLIPTSFNEIIEANKDVLQRLKDKTE